MLTKEEIDKIISDKNGGMEAIYEIAKQSYLKGHSEGYEEGFSNGETKGYIDAYG